MNEDGALILRNIKECIDFLRGGTSRCIEENNKGLVLLLIRLEGLFRRGLRKKKGSDYYDYFAACLKKDMDFGCHFKKVEMLQELKTSTGRGRVILRFLVSLNVLGNFLELCLCAKATSNWYAANAYLRQQIFVDKFLTLLSEINAYQFNIEIRTKEIDFVWPFEETLFKHENEFFLNSSSIVCETKRIDNAQETVTGLVQSDCKDLKISALEAKINILESNCRMLLEQVEEKNESRRKQTDLDNLRQISLFARSSPDGSYNLSNVSLEEAELINSSSVETYKTKSPQLAEVVMGSDWFTDEQKVKFESIFQTLKNCDTRYTSIENNILLLLDKIPQIESKLQSITASTNSTDLLEELMEQQRVLSDEIASHALLEQTMLDDKKELELKVENLTANLNEAKKATVHSTASIACQTSEKSYAYPENPLTDGNASISSFETAGSSVSPNDSAVNAKLGTDFERLAHKYSDALRQIAELEELKERTHSPAKSTGMQDTILQLKSEVNDLKSQLACASGKLVHEEERCEELVTDNNAKDGEILELQNTVKELDEYHLIAVQDKSNLEAEVLNLKKEIENLRRQNLEAEMEKVTLTSKCAELSELLAAPSKDVLKLEELRKEKEMREAELNEEVAKLKDNLNCTVASTQSQVDAITAERNSIQKMYVDVKRQLFIQVRILSIKCL